MIYNPVVYEVERVQRAMLGLAADWYKGTVDKTEITSVTFYEDYVPSSYTESFDASYSGDGSVTGYLVNGTEYQDSVKTVTSYSLSSVPSQSGPGKKSLSPPSWDGEKWVFSSPVSDTQGLYMWAILQGIGTSYPYYILDSDPTVYYHYISSSAVEVYSKILPVELIVSGNGTGKIVPVSLDELFLEWSGMTSCDMSAVTASGKSGSMTFRLCSSLSSVVLPDDLDGIGSMCFYNCSSLQSISIPETVTNLGASAFSGCNKLTTILIPKNVSSVGYNAFSNCSSLLNINVVDDNQSLSSENGILYNKAKTILVAFPNGKSGAVSVPSTVTEVGAYSFTSSGKVTSISLPDNLQTIGASAFSSCSGITTMTVPQNVTEIPTGAFTSCSSLVSVYLPNGIQSIGTSAFRYCSKLTTISIPVPQDVVINLPESGVFYVMTQSAPSSTTVITANTTIRNYDFAADNRTSVVFQNP